MVLDYPLAQDLQDEALAAVVFDAGQDVKGRAWADFDFEAAVAVAVAAVAVAEAVVDTMSGTDLVVSAMAVAEAVEIGEEAEGAAFLSRAGRGAASLVSASSVEWSLLSVWPLSSGAVGVSGDLSIELSGHSAVPDTVITDEKAVKVKLAQLESDALDAEIQTLMAENAKLKCQAAQRAALAKPAVKPAVKRSGGTSKAGRQRSRFVP